MTAQEIKTKVHRIKLAAPRWLGRILFVAGLTSLAFGFGMIYRPLGFVSGGAMATWLAILMMQEPKNFS